MEVDVTHLDVFVLLSQVHESVVGPDGLAELAHVDADGQEVLPDLPVLVVALQSLLQGTECLCPEGTQNQTEPRRHILSSEFMSQHT